MSLQRVDADGYLLPWCEDDRYIECGFDDPDYGPAEGWPSWVDESTWELGPAIPPDATIEPFEPSEDDLADYAEWSAELGRGFPAEFPPSSLTDQDIIAAGGAV